MTQYCVMFIYTLSYFGKSVATCCNEFINIKFVCLLSETNIFLPASPLGVLIFNATSLLLTVVGQLPEKKYGLCRYVLGRCGARYYKKRLTSLEEITIQSSGYF